MKNEIFKSFKLAKIFFYNFLIISSKTLRFSLKTSFFNSCISLIKLLTILILISKN